MSSAEKKEKPAAKTEPEKNAEPAEKKTAKTPDKAPEKPVEAAKAADPSPEPKKAAEKPKDEPKAEAAPEKPEEEVKPEPPKAPEPPKSPFAFERNEETKKGRVIAKSDACVCVFEWSERGKWFSDSVILPDLGNAIAWVESRF